MLLVLLLIFSPAILTAAIVFTTLAIKSRGRRRILMFGIPATAIVQSLRQTTGRAGMMPVVKLNLQVVPANGQAFAATLKQVISPANAYLFQPGARLAVKYDPAKPGRVALVPGSN